MSTIYATAAEAIEDSAQGNTITRCANTAQNMEELHMLCSDDAEGDELEFWGEDDNGNEWRVHVPAAA